MKTQLSIIITVLFIFTISLAEAVHFPDISPTNNWIHFIGKLSINNHDPVNGTDEVAVFVDDGNGGELMVGKTTVGSTVNNNYFISIYGDDAQTPQKDGAKSGDTLVFKIWSSLDNVEQTLQQNQLTTESAPGLTLPEVPPTYHTSHLEQFGYLHLAMSTQLSENDSRHSIPTNTNFGILCFMFILILMVFMRKRYSC
jgi:hypothetical protein